MKDRIRIGSLLVAVLVALAPQVAADFQIEQKIQGDSLTVRNLIGEITIRGHEGSTFEVRIHVQGKDAKQEAMRIDAEQGGDAELNVVFPEAKEYVYPRMGRGSRTNFSTKNHDGWLSAVLGELTGSGRITVRGSGSGLEVWADVEILVPSGTSLTVRHGVGEITATDVGGSLVLDSSSGSVGVAGVDGNLSVDTGSGRVTAENIRGDVLIDTGSGNVQLSQVDGNKIDVDTGSGRVELDDISGSRVHIDTGSGGVRASRIRTDSALIDTGSGGVTLELERMGTGSFEIDTGSGGITLIMPTGASADVIAETGSGGVDVDLGSESINLRRHDRDEISFTVGGGDARVRLDTGSGGIRIKSAN